MAPKRKRLATGDDTLSSPGKDPLGSILNGRLHRFPEFIEAATIYHQLHAEESTVTNLPKIFIVPTTPEYPSHLHGLKLNTAQVRTHYKNGNLHPESVEALRAIHFVFDVNELKWTLKIQAFEAYKEIYGDLKIQQDFVVPTNNSQWPKDTWGMRLGLAVRSMRQKADMCPERQQQLTSMGFVWNILEQSWETKLLALRTYKSIYGDLLVPYSFKTPVTENAEAINPWPVATRNLKLGHAVHNLRQNIEDMPASRRDILNSMGFIWDCLELSWDTKIVALTRYKELYGDLVVPYSFRVPRNDSNWPTDTWDLKLGHAVHNMRQNATDMNIDRREQLNRLGFIWEGLDHSWDTKILALQTFERFYGHVNVSTNFKVPSTDPWPQDTWNMKLGAMVIALRQQRRDMGDGRRRLLDSIGFLWQQPTPPNTLPSSINSPPSPPVNDTWDLFIECLHIFRRCYGYSTSMPIDFVVPVNTIHWPQYAWNFPLGQWLYRTTHKIANSIPIRVTIELDRMGFSARLETSRGQQPLDEAVRQPNISAETPARWQPIEQRYENVSLREWQSPPTLPRLPGLGRRRG